MSGTSPGQSTFDGNPVLGITAGYRPGLADANGAACQNDPTNLPDPQTEPAAECWNYYGAQHASHGKAVACAGFGINAGSSPTFQFWWTAALTQASNPFDIVRVAAGNYKISHSGAASTWAASTVYALNAYVVPNPGTGFFYKATSVSGSGTSGTSQPTFPTTIGATVTDNAGGNQIVWTCVAATLPMGLPLAGWPKPFLNIVGGAHNYGIQATYITGGMQVTTQQDGTLTDLAFSADFF